MRSRADALKAALPLNANVRRHEINPRRGNTGCSVCANVDGVVGCHVPYALLGMQGDDAIQFSLARSSGVHVFGLLGWGCHCAFR